MSRSASTSPLPIPPHYDPDRVDSVWRVPYNELAPKAVEWAKEHNLMPAFDDELKVCLLLIDFQNTFCTPDFELFVGPSAIDDSRRLCQFIYKNLGVITQITATLDTHTAMQIFHPVFFVNEEGAHPSPGTEITRDDVEKGVWKANEAVAAAITDGDYSALQRHLEHYVRTLQEADRYDLTVWPYHAMLGGIGHALVSAVEEACFFHNIARQSQIDYQIKGNNPLTENYSILLPEVLTGADGSPIAEKNEKLLRQLALFDRVIIAGQAKSHCVAWTVDDLIRQIKDEDPSFAKKVYLLEDCTSPVIIPGVADYTEAADKAFERFASEGMNVVRSTDPIQQWPGFLS